jgi:PAS domain S-box-containing protein
VVTATVDVTERKLAEEALRRGREELEQLVVEQTEELTALNQELRKEITERKQAEGLLRQANECVEMILASMTEAFAVLDSDWRYKYLNRHAQEQVRSLGKNPAELIGKVLWDEFPSLPIEKEFRRAMRERVTITHDFYYPPLREWLENRIYPTADGGLAIFQMCITEHKRTEKELARANARIAEILESITDEFYAFDRGWRYTYVNERALSSIQSAMGEELTREEVLGKNLWEMFPAILGSVFDQKTREALREQQAVHLETYSQPSDRWAEVHAYPSEEGLSVYSRDITARKLAEEKLAYHAHLLENIHDAVIATDERFVLTAWNKAAEQMYGWRADEVLGRNVWEVVRSDLTDDQRAETSRELFATGRRHVEVITYHKDGTPVYVEGRSVALRGVEGQIIGYVGINRDITERKQAAEKAKEADKARREQELKSAFLDALAHEVKSPLTASSLAVTALLADNGRISVEQRRELLGIIDRNLNRLNTWSSETIRAASIEARTLALKREPQDIGIVIRSIIDELAKDFQDARLRVNIPDVPRQVEVDREMIKYVMRLLLGNALKYSPPGSPLVISCYYETEAAIVSVKDFGPGIPLDEQDWVFEKYYRGRASAGNSGTGLGLAIAKSIIRAHCGNLWVISEPGCGADFRFSLPSVSSRIHNRGYLL